MADKSLSVDLYLAQVLPASEALDVMTNWSITLRGRLYFSKECAV